MAHPTQLPPIQNLWVRLGGHHEFPDHFNTPNGQVSGDFPERRQGRLGKFRRVQIMRNTDQLALRGDLNVRLSPLR